MRGTLTRSKSSEFTNFTQRIHTPLGTQAENVTNLSLAVRACRGVIQHLHRLFVCSPFVSDDDPGEVMRLGAGCSPILWYRPVVGREAEHVRGLLRASTQPLLSSVALNLAGQPPMFMRSLSVDHVGFMGCCRLGRFPRRIQDHQGGRTAREISPILL